MSLIEHTQSAERAPTDTQHTHAHHRISLRHDYKQKEAVTGWPVEPQARKREEKRHNELAASKHLWPTMVKQHTLTE